MISSMLLTLNLAQMKTESRDLQNSTTAAISYSECYAPFIIFLDIDGVFNCQLFYKSQQFNDYKEAKKSPRKSLNAKGIERLDYYQSQICRERIGWFNELCKEVNAFHQLGVWVNLLNNCKCGGSFRIIGKTEHLGYERGIEISKWLKDNVKPETYGCNYYDFLTDTQ